MRQVTKIAPLHSLIFIMDPNNRDIPEPASPRYITANKYCVVVPTFAEVDGETEIALIDSSSERLDACTKLVFEGIVSFESRRVSILNSSGLTLLSYGVSDSDVWIRIWTNGLPDPEVVTVEVVK